MKTKLKKTILFLSTILLFVRCEERIQIEMDQKGKTLTVDAFLNNLRKNQVVRLTYTDSYFSGKTPPPIYGASVILNDLTSNKMYEFTDTNDGNYIFTLLESDTIIITNHTYQLNIKYNSYEYSAISTCKRSTNIDNLFFKQKEIVTNDGSDASSGTTLFLSARDSIGSIPDYYQIKIYKNDKYYGRPENIQLAAFGDHNELDGYLFDENVWATSGPNGTFDFCQSGDKVKLEIYGISEETYDFLRIGKQMSSNSGLFATTPVNLPSNVYPLDKSYPKSVGLFSVSDVTYREVVTP